LGIDVPVEGAEGKNYTWFDALLIYLGYKRMGVT
jgi:methionyl-tRNA synthetase